MDVYEEGYILTLDNGDQLLLMKEYEPRVNDLGQEERVFVAEITKYNEETGDDEETGEFYDVRLTMEDGDAYIRIKDRLFIDAGDLV